MINLKSQTHRRQQIVAFAALSLWAAGLTTALSLMHSAYFQRFFGVIHPLLAIALVTAAGGLALKLLHARGGFEVFKATARLRGVVLSAALATLFAVEVVVADHIIRFPADMNVPLPHALLFYPAIAYVAEIVFHALPLALLILFLGPLLKGLRRDRLVWLGIFLTALLEPTFQAGFEEEPISWAGAYVWVHLYAFNLLQLYVFKRYDFASMYAFRLFYYLYWHIAWGFVRLQVLF